MENIQILIGQTAGAFLGGPLHGQLWTGLAQKEFVHEGAVYRLSYRLISAPGTTITRVPVLIYEGASS